MFFWQGILSFWICQNVLLHFSLLKFHDWFIGSISDITSIKVWCANVRIAAQICSCNQNNCYRWFRHFLICVFCHPFSCEIASTIQPRSINMLKEKVRLEKRLDQLQKSSWEWPRRRLTRSPRAQRKHCTRRRKQWSGSRMTRRRSSKGGLRRGGAIIRNEVACVLLLSYRACSLWKC